MRDSMETDVFFQRHLGQERFAGLYRTICYAPRYRRIFSRIGIARFLQNQGQFTRSASYEFLRPILLAS